MPLLTLGALVNQPVAFKADKYQVVDITIPLPMGNIDGNATAESQ
jgi:hypothetical protein